MSKNSNQQITEDDPNEPYGESTRRESRLKRYSQHEFHVHTDPDPNVPTPFWKKNLAIVIAIVIGVFIFLGLFSDSDYFLVLGLVFLAFIVLSMIVAVLASTHRNNYWDYVVLDDLFRLLGYIIMAIIKLLAAIAESKK